MSHKAVVFVYSSFGEFEWQLPLIKALKRCNYDLHVVFRSKKVYSSILDIERFSRFIRESCNSHIIYQSEKKLFLKLLWKFLYKSDIKYGMSLIGKMTNYWNEYKSFNLNQGDVIIAEIPVVKKLDYAWFQRMAQRGVKILLTPHSTYPYFRNSPGDNRSYSSMAIGKSNIFVLLGFKNDFEVLRKSYHLNTQTPVVFGHPKYLDIGDSANAEQHTLKINQKVAYIISRGPGSYFDEKYYSYLINCVVKELISFNYTAIIKLHPREKSELWTEVALKYPQFRITQKFPNEVAMKVDIVVAFWSSLCIDFNFKGTPVIEFFDPFKWRKQQLCEGHKWTTIYRKLDLVYSANNRDELNGLLSRHEDEPLVAQQTFLDQIKESSFDWELKLKKILIA